MIRIDRAGQSAPPGFASEATNALQPIAAAVAAGALTSNHFKKAVYASEAVKEAVWRVQHRKCCFCERPYERKFSTVEHFRPKTTARDATGLRVPGYWWLGYDFDNLYFACAICNNAKNDWFPVDPPTARLVFPQHPRTHAEACLIVDPAVDEPEAHLTYVEDLSARGRYRIAARDVRGEWTIRACALDRDDLDELRDAWFDDMVAPVMAAHRRGVDVGDLVVALVAPRREFALLARVAFRDAGML